MEPIDKIIDGMFKNPPKEGEDYTLLEDELEKDFQLLTTGGMKTVNFEKLSALAGRLALFIRHHKRIRVVFDYDPDALYMEFRYYIPKDAPLDQWKGRLT